VGKEYMADQPAVEKEITNAIRTAARSLRLFISRSVRLARERRRLDVFAKFLPKIAEFATKLSDREEPPDITPLLAVVSKAIPEVEEKIKEVPDIGGRGD
jgi:DNA topoisomerase VI subunit B